MIEMSGAFADALVGLAAHVVLALDEDLVVLISWRVGRELAVLLFRFLVLFVELQPIVYGDVADKNGGNRGDCPFGERNSRLQWMRGVDRGRRNFFAGRS